MNRQDCFTVNLTAVVCVSVPRVPVNVTVRVPWLTFIGGRSVITAVPLPPNATGLEIVQVEFGGPPLPRSATLPVSPPNALVEMVNFPS